MGGEHREKRRREGTTTTTTETIPIPAKRSQQLTEELSHSASSRHKNGAGGGWGGEWL